jgi:hypothetical protein
MKARTSMLYSIIFKAIEATHVDKSTSQNAPPLQQSGIWSSPIHKRD